MHLSSLEKMQAFVVKYLGTQRDKNLTILDLGSTEIGGSYRQFFDSPLWTYTGLDLRPGKNVDLVLSNPYHWQELPSHTADVFITGQTFEHIEYFWITILEIVRVLKPGGLCCILAPSAGPIHRYPVDCWRFLPDGFEALARYADLEVLEISHDLGEKPYTDQSEVWQDLLLVARKKETTNADQHYQREINLKADDSLTKIIAQVPESSTILELGPATGYLTQYLTQEKNCIVDCVEISSTMAQKVEPLARKLVVGDLNTLDLAQTLGNEQYDVILAADILEHLSYNNTVLKQCYELLKEDGCLIVSVPNIAHASIIAALCQGEFSYTQDGLLDKSHIRFFTQDSICQELTSKGFLIAHLAVVHKLPHETELGDTPSNLPPAIEEYLMSRPQATAYQFIITATKIGPQVHRDLLPTKNKLQSLYLESLYQNMDEQKEKYEQEIANLTAGLKEAQGLAFERLDEINNLHAQTSTLHQALDHAQTLALSRLEEIDRLQNILHHPLAFIFKKIMTIFNKN